MFKIKKLVSAILMGAMVICMSVTAFGAESHNELQNISTEAPAEIAAGDIALFGLSKPSTDNWVNLNDEKLTFSGNAKNSTLYTNKHFTGKSSIEYSITNDSDSTLTVKFYTSSGWFKSKKIVIADNATLTGTIDGLDADKLYYLTFSAPSDFSGSVK